MRASITIGGVKRDVVARRRASPRAWMSRGRLEARERRPQEVHRRCAWRARRRRSGRRSGQSANAGIAREPRGGVRARRRSAGRRRRGSPDRRRARRARRAGSVGRENSRGSVAHRIAEPEPHALRALVDRAARCSRACPSTGSRTRRGRSRVACARARASSVARKSCRSTSRSVTQQELRQRELPLAEDAERARHRLAPVALAHDGGGERVIAGLAVRTRGARTAGITSGKSGDSSSCSRSPMKKSSWRGLPTTVAG